MNAQFIQAVTGYDVNLLEPIPPQFFSFKNLPAPNSNDTVPSSRQQHIDTVSIRYELQVTMQVTADSVENDDVIFFALKVVYCVHLHTTDDF